MQGDKENAGPLGGVCTFNPPETNRRGGMHLPACLSFEALDYLVSIMDVQLIALSECTVEPGSALDLEECDTPSLHYIQEGLGRLSIPNGMPVEIGPQTLVIVPPKCRFRFEPGRTGTTAAIWNGIFRSLCGNSVDLFDTLQVPVIEQFSKADALESRLQLALTEMAAPDVCSDVLVSIAIKQIIVALIRRSFLSRNSWTRRFSALSVAEYGSGPRK